MRVLRGEDLIEQRLGGVGKYQAGKPVDGHEHEAGNDESLARLDERPDLGPIFLRLGFFFGESAWAMRARRP